MNVLVTGANGFIGKGLVRTLAGRGDSACGIYSKQVPAGDHTRGFHCDLSRRESVDGILSELLEGEWDCVVHLASVLCNDTTDDEQVFDTNLQITRNLIRICRGIRPKQLVHASSMAVYPNLSGTYSENSVVRPSENAEGMYGLSKLCAENLFDHQLRNDGIAILHLRLAQVWGDGMRPDRIMSIMARELEESGKITVFGNGERVSNFIHIDRVLAAIAGLLGREGGSGVFNLGHESLSYLDLARRVAAAHGNSDEVITKVEHGSRARFVLDTTKFEEQFDDKL